MKPLKFNPVFKERLWGSSRLKEVFNKSIPLDIPIGESWECADLPEGCSLVEIEDGQKISFSEFIDNYGKSYGLAEKQCHHPFGLLIKFLDANQVLSVQVHPDVNACKILPGARVKTECWYVLDAAPDAYIYKGFTGNVSQKELEESINNNSVDKILNKIMVNKGDFFFLPAGTIHAIGPGLLIAEIQTPSDTTYRVYDWDRIGADGKSRQLHIQESLVSCHYTNTPPIDFSVYENLENPSHEVLYTVGKAMGNYRHLADCEYFSVAYAAAKAGDSCEIDVNLPFVFIALEGNGKITDQSDNTQCTFTRGDTILVPASNNICIKTENVTEALLTCLGPGKK